MKNIDVFATLLAFWRTLGRNIFSGFETSSQVIKKNLLWLLNQITDYIKHFFKVRKMEKNGPLSPCKFIGFYRVCFVI